MSGFLTLQCSDDDFKIDNFSNESWLFDNELNLGHIVTRFVNTFIFMVATWTLCYNLYTKCKLNRQNKQIRRTRRRIKGTQLSLNSIRFLNMTESRQINSSLWTFNKRHHFNRYKRANNYSRAKAFKINRKMIWKFSVSSWRSACRIQTNSPTKC